MSKDNQAINDLLARIKVLEKFNGVKSPEPVVVSPINTFIEQLDSLVNSKDHSALAEHKVQVTDSITSFNASDYSDALQITRQRSTEFIGLVNDVTSNYSELNEQLASNIVVALSELEIKLMDKDVTTHPTTMPGNIAASSVIAPVTTNETALSIKDIVDAVLATKAGSKERNSKVKFYTSYYKIMAYSDTELFIAVLHEAAKLVLSSDVTTTGIINKLLVA